MAAFLPPPSEQLFSLTPPPLRIRDDRPSETTAIMSTTTPAGFNRTIPLSRLPTPKSGTLSLPVVSERSAAHGSNHFPNLVAVRQRRLSAKTWLALWSVNTTDLADRERHFATALEAITPLKAAKKPTRRSKKTSRPAPTSFDQALTEWSSAVTGRPAPWETLAVAEVLFRVGEHLKAETFTSCLAVLARGFGRSSQANLSHATAGESLSEKTNPIDCEVPWVTSLILSPLNGAARLQRSGLLALQQLLRDSTDPHGLPIGSALRQLPDVLRTLARSTAWARIFISRSGMIFIPTCSGSWRPQSCSRPRLSQAPPTRPLTFPLPPAPA
ncbi:MAG UNVERIFIED_CONTAM: hypothetical protein LVR18_30035 [Planctomycetaceae bacterium]|jgi:hypothetical protein